MEAEEVTFCSHRSNVAKLEEISPCILFLHRLMGYPPRDGRDARVTRCNRGFLWLSWLRLVQPHYKTYRILEQESLTLFYSFLLIL